MGKTAVLHPLQNLVSKSLASQPSPTKDEVNKPFPFMICLVDKSLNRGKLLFITDVASFVGRYNEKFNLLLEPLAIAQPG